MSIDSIVFTYRLLTEVDPVNTELMADRKLHVIDVKFFIKELKNDIVLHESMHMLILRLKKANMHGWTQNEQQTICVHCQQTISQGSHSKTNDLLTKLKTERFKFTVMK